MKAYRILPVLAVLFLVGADKPEDDAKKLEGAWDLVGEQVGGKLRPIKKGDLDYYQMKIAGNRMTIKGAAAQSTETFKIYPTKSPKAIDSYIRLVSTNGDKGPEIIIPGIYKFEGDKLYIAGGEIGKKRPTDFTGTVQVYQRVKQ